MTKYRDLPLTPATSLSFKEKIEISEQKNIVYSRKTRKSRGETYGGETSVELRRETCWRRRFYAPNLGVNFTQTLPAIAPGRR